VSEIGSAGAVSVRSFLDRSRDAVFARGSFEDIFDGYLTHAKGLGPLPGEVALGLMRRSLAAATLHLALLPPDQFCAWTLNIVEPPLNLFLAGDNDEFQITGRIFSRDVRTAKRNRLFVETQRTKHEPSRSTLDFEGLDLLPIFEQYYDRSVQIRARIFELDRDDFLLVQGLPRVDEAWIQGLGAGDARAHVERDLETVEQRTNRFHCGCNAQKILVVVRGMFASRPDELFRGENQVEVQCPRCGRTWLVARTEFDARDSKLGFS